MLLLTAKGCLMDDFFVRFAQTEDCLDVYEWEFDPSTRVYMQNKELVNFKSHEKWFLAAMGSASRSLLICSDKNKKKVGVLRVDYDSEMGEAALGITIAPSMRGRGYGKYCLMSSMSFILEHIATPKQFSAVVHKDNHASVKAFKSSGFTETKNCGSSRKFLKPVDTPHGY